MKINNKLVNVAIFLFIINLIYQTSGLWSIIIEKSLKIIFPFLIAFTISYALYPYSLKLQKFKIPKAISNIIVLLFLLILFLFLIIYLSISINQFRYLIFKNKKLIIPIIKTSFNYITDTIIIISLTIYFLFDMDNIKKIFINNKYFQKINKAMKNYLFGFTKIIFITLIEYTLAFLIIGHPNAIIIGILASISNLIPYLGGIIINIIAIILAFRISKKLLIRTIILFLILSIIDGYIINPYIYSKTNKIHPIIIILSVFSGGVLFGIIGIVISLPLTIIIIETIKYYVENK